MDSRVVEYPISPKYVPNWRPEHAIREVIANALDTETRVKVSWADGTATIEDRAEGIPQEFWVLGEGQGGAIGQFHEGMKLAAMVLARENRSVLVDTVGYSVRPLIAHSSTYGTDVLALEFEPSERTAGTSVAIQCSEEEFASARDLFRKFKSPPVLHGGLNILDAPGAIYITGVYVQHVNALWGYDFSAKQMANRDRSVLDMAGIHREVSRILARLNKVELMRSYLEAASSDPSSSLFELGLNAYPDDKNHTLWRRAFRETFGEKACLPVGLPEADNFVSRRGYAVVNFPWSVNNLLRSVGVLTAQDVLKKMARATFVWPETPLSEVEKTVLERAKQIAKELVPNAEIGQTHVVEGFPALDGPNCMTEGLYRNGMAYIKRSALQPPESSPRGIMMAVARSAGILIHERLHGRGFRDETREFEYEMTLIMGHLAAKLAEEGIGCARRETT